MSKKKSDRKEKGTALPSDNADPRQMMEQVMRDIQKMFDEHGVESVEEANALMQDIMASGGRPPHSTNRSALERAQDMMYRAWEARSKSQAVKLARKALEISPDCADAYVLLAQATARTAQETKALYEKGVEAGKRAIGAEFDDLVGEFWGFLETRPYMRAREGLAYTLWELGEKQQAIEHYRDMLRLNPNDNQGIRDVLLDCLLELEQWDDAEKLLKKYKDDWSARWFYTQAFCTLRREGASKKADKQLQKAMDQNQFVPPYLLGKKKLPKQLPAFISPGREDEAVHYAVSAVSIWGKSPTALQWLQKMVDEYKPKPPW
jgi:tetratricopeptide (TPR) repeat protein